MTDEIELNIPKKYAIRLKTNALDFDGIIVDMCNEINYLQFKLDSLMMEYCPEDMTQKQIDNWADNQRAAKQVEVEFDAN